MHVYCSTSPLHCAYEGLSVMYWAWMGWGMASEPPLITSPISKLFSTFFSGSGGFVPLWQPIVHPWRYIHTQQHALTSQRTGVLHTHTYAVRKPCHALTSQRTGVLQTHTYEDRKPWLWLVHPDSSMISGNQVEWGLTILMLVSQVSARYGARKEDSLGH